MISKIFLSYKEATASSGGVTQKLDYNERVKEILRDRIHFDDEFVKYIITAEDANIIIEMSLVLNTTKDIRTRLVTITEYRSYYVIIDNEEKIILGEDIFAYDIITLWKGSTELEHKFINHHWMSK